MRMEGKRCVVTGAAQGFGLGIAETFLREGAQVAMMDIQEEKVAEAAAGLGAGAHALACDVAAADGTLEEAELRLLEEIRYELNIDRLHAAAIERGARARHLS